MRETYYTAEEIQQKLEIKERTLRRWCAERKIPFYKIGGRLWFKKSEIETWIQKHKQ